MDYRHVLDININVHNEAANAKLKQTGAVVTEIDTILARLDTKAKSTKTSLLGMGLGATFFLFGVNMQLERMLRSMFKVFEQAEGSVGLLNQQFNIVRANLAAISIAFWDAFAQSDIFMFLVDVLSNIVDGYLNLTDAQREWVTTGVVTTFGLTKVIQFVGQALLAVYLIIELLKVKWIASAAAMALPWIGWGLVALYVIYNVFKNWNKFKENLSKGWANIGRESELHWTNWAAKVLDKILSVVSYIFRLPGWLLKWLFGAPGGILGMPFDFIADVTDEIKRLNEEVNTLKQPFASTGAGSNPYAPGYNPYSITPTGGIYGVSSAYTTGVSSAYTTGTPEEKELLKLQIDYQKKSSSSLDDMNSSFEEVKRLLSQTLTVKIEGQTYSSASS